MTNENDGRLWWLYMRENGTVGWRLVLHVPLRNAVNATAIASIVREELKDNRQFSIREDGKKAFQILP